VALALLTTQALADGASKKPVYTAYDQPARVTVHPYTPPPTIVVTRKRDDGFVVVPAVLFQGCCYCPNVALAMSVAAGGQIVYNN
jgi:hypothetical protein